MKTLIILFLAIASASAQTVLRVNNTPGVNAPYTTLAAAITAAGVNDIILVEGSATSYGTHTITKKVTIVGPGYFLSENTGLQVTLNEAILDNLNLNAGSDGSKISGLRLNAGGIYINGVSNIEVTNNYVGVVSLSGAGSNIIVKGNYMGTFASNGTHTSVLVSNNYLWGQAVVNSGTVLFSNNTCNLNGTSSFVGSVVQNNIFIGFPVTRETPTSSTFNNNVFQQATLADADLTNVFNVAVASLFLGLAGNTTDTQWRLKAGSPAIGAGLGGVDCGMYGGSTPYKPSGIATGQHTIHALTVPATVIQNGTLNVKVSAKVN
jgi:hypothetical protein